MKTTMQRVYVCLIALFIITSCQKDPFLEDETTVEITVNYPDMDGDLDVKSMTFHFREINSGDEKTEEIDPAELEGGYRLRLPYGTYIATAEGEVEVGGEAPGNNYVLKGYAPNVVLNSESARLDFDLFLSDPEAKFVFKEIFFTGTRTPEDKPYNGDKYFIIYNNSTEVLYADGLLIAQSSFNTTTQRDYRPDVMDEAFTSEQIIMLPGSGTDHPVNPGEQIVIANNAINHLEYNSNSLDLTGADFEIEMIGSIEVDNPDVPNTINVVGNLTMHNQGYKSYVLAELPEDMTVEQFIEESAYTYSYIAVNGREMFFDANKIPNEYIIDAVNLSVQEEFEWFVMVPQLDMGWTYCGTTASDNNRFGKAVIRKVAADSEDGVVFLQDTNNSTQDFEAAVAPSLK